MTTAVPAERARIRRFYVDVLGATSMRLGSSYPVTGVD